MEYKEINEDEMDDEILGLATSSIVDKPEVPVPAAPPQLPVTQSTEMTTVEVVEGLQSPPQEMLPEVIKEKGTRGKSTTADVFKNLIPSTDRLYVYKIDTKGHKGYVGNYSSSDLARSAGIEVFIKDYVVPTWGPGDYVVEVRDASGKIKKHGLVPIPAPVIQPKETNMLTLQEILAAQQQMQVAADKKASEQFAGMTTMMSMMKEMMPKGEKAGNDGNMMLPMMMMMMFMGQQQQKQSGPDPLMQMLIQKLSQQDQQPQFPPPIPFPLPAPMPTHDPVSSSSSMAEILKTVVEAVKLSQPQPVQQNESMTNILTTVLAKIMQPDRNSITAKDILEMMPTIKDMISPNKEGITTFNDYLEGLMRLDEIRGGNSEGPSLLAGLAEMVTGVVRDIKLQQMQLEYQKIGQPKSIQKQLPKPMQMRTQIQPQSPSVANQEEERKSKVPDVPIGFRKFVVRMSNAQKKNEPAGLIMAFFEGLLFLRDNSSEWAPYVEEMMISAAKGDKARAQKFCEVFLYSFAKKKLMTPELVGITKKVLSDNWETIIKETGLAKALEGTEEQSEKHEIQAEATPVVTPPPIQVVETDDSVEEESEDDEVDLENYGVEIPSEDNTTT